MLTASDLTVASVSGIIAAVVTILQLLVPLALPLILLAFLHEENEVSTAPAISWSVIGSFLHASRWPTLLHADSAAVRSIPRSILFVTRSSTIIAIVIGVTAIVTPLGLYEAVVASDDTHPETFHYIADTSPFGYGTPPRIDLAWSRICGSLGPSACPNSWSNVTRTRNDTTLSVTAEALDSRLPQYVIDAFQSGLTNMSGSVSSIFDIQSRSYTWTTLDDSVAGIPADDGASFPVSTYRQIESLLMDSKIHVIEGLIADLEKGGIGFRNHSAPPVQTFGSSWTEDILFIEPESYCVDTNLTLDFMIPRLESQTKHSSSVTNLRLTDHGGFANLVQDSPEWDREDPQNNPRLEYRAYRAAWLTNAYTMAFMNVTSMANESIAGSRAFSYLNSSVGKSFPLMREDGSGGPDLLSVRFDTMMTTSTFGILLDGLDEAMEATNYTAQYNLSSMVDTPYQPPLYSNPFGVNRTSFYDVGYLCRGAEGQDYANISNYATECGLLFGAPRRLDGSASIVFNPGSNWTIPMYGCISTTKAIIKTVTFQFNGSDDLSGLSVLSAEDKTYPDDASKPLWGVELTEEPLIMAHAIWGLVSGPVQGNISISTLRKESLYVPGYAFSGIYGSMPDYQNLPGIDFHANALTSIYEIMGAGSSAGTPDYSGQTNLAMFRRWQDLSRTPQTASQILDLIWTDLAANSVVGTRGLHHSIQKRHSSPASNTLPVTVYERRVRFHLPYGIPAFIALAATVLVLLSTLVALLSGNAGLQKMRHFLAKTSQGRIMTAQVASADSRAAFLPISDAKTRPWIARIGLDPVSLVMENDALGPSDAGTQYSHVAQADPFLVACEQGDGVVRQSVRPKQ